MPVFLSLAYAAVTQPLHSRIRCCVEAMSVPECQYDIWPIMAWSGTEMQGHMNVYETIQYGDTKRRQADGTMG